MALPTNTFKFTDPMDPKDRVDFLLNLSGVGGMLETGETVATYTLTMRSEGVALGVSIGVTTYAPSQPTTSSILFWVEVDSTNWSNVAFDGTGTTVGIEVDITTNSTPARRRQRTVAIQVAQQ